MNRPLHGGNLNWAASIAGCPISALTDFSASINPLGTPAVARAAIVDNLQNLTAYPDPNYPELRCCLAEHHQIDPQYILPGNGVAELLTWVGRSLAQLEQTYLITPAFGDYYRALNTFDGRVIDCPLPLATNPDNLNFTDSDLSRDLSRDLSAFSLSALSSLESTLPCSGLLLNNPHNPTGKLWSRAEILPYLEQFELVVIDEAFMDFLPPAQEQSLIPLVEEHPNLIILRSLTKFYSLPGLRIGYAIAQPEKIKRWQSWRDPWAVNTLAVKAAQAAVLDRDFQQRTWRWLDFARPRLEQQLAAIPGLSPFPGAANYLLVATERSTVELQRRLLTEYQLVIRDCLSFAELGDRYFRVAVRLPKENDRLAEAITAIVGAGA